MGKKYDYKLNGLRGFYEWNSDKFIVRRNNHRKKEFDKFRKENGFSPDECWNLMHSTAVFILPRLKYLKKRCEEIKYHPFKISFKKWMEILDKMIFSFDFYVRDKERFSLQEARKAEEGIKVFAKWFYCLWY